MIAVNTPYIVSSRVSSIQVEIMEKGPVEAAFTVYRDFNYYKSGKCNGNSMLQDSINCILNINNFLI